MRGPPPGRCLKHPAALEALSPAPADWLIRAAPAHCLTRPLPRHFSRCPNCGARIADTVYSVSALERTLAMYMADPAAAAQAFDVRTVPVIAADQEMQDRRKKDVFVEEAPSVSATAAAKAAASGAVVPGNDERGQELRAEALAKVPELANLGPLLISSKQIELTETEVRRVPSKKGGAGLIADARR